MGKPIIKKKNQTIKNQNVLRSSSMLQVPATPPRSPRFGRLRQFPTSVFDSRTPNAVCTDSIFFPFPPFSSSNSFAVITLSRHRHSFNSDNFSFSFVLLVFSSVHLFLLHFYVEVRVFRFFRTSFAVLYTTQFNELRVKKLFKKIRGKRYLIQFFLFSIFSSLFFFSSSLIVDSLSFKDLFFRIFGQVDNF